MSRKRLVLIILGVGVVLGFCLGIGMGVLTSGAGRRAFRGAFSSEEPADVAHPCSIDRDGFALEYPGNWRIEGGGRGDDPDSLLSLDSPGNSFVTLAIYDMPTDPADNLAIQLEHFVPSQMARPAREDLDRWGAYEGRGVVLKGRTVIGAMPARLRIFSSSGPTRPFVVVEMVFDEDRADVEPGLGLVEETFRLKP